MAREREREQRGKNSMSMRERARREAEKRKSGSGKFTCVELPEGISALKVVIPEGKDQVVKKLDIVPFILSHSGYRGMMKGDQWYEYTYFVHPNVGVENKVRLCPTTFAKPCPICETRQAMLDRGVPYNDPAVKALKKKERQLFNVIDLDDEEKAVKIFDVSYHLFGAQLEEELRSQDPEVAGFAELKDGYTLTVRFGTKVIPGPDNKPGKPFMEAKRIDFKERKDYKESILDDVIDLEACLVPIEYDKLKAEFMEEDEVDDDDSGEDREEEPRGRRRRESEDEDRGSRKRKESEDEEPKRDRKRRDEPEEEPEEEEPPKKDRKRKDEPDEEPKRERSRGRRDEPEEEEEKPSGKKFKCPNKKGEFGVDNGNLDDCQDCDKELYDACTDEYDRLKKEKKKGK